MELALNKVNKETGEVTGTVNVEVRAYPIAEPKGKTKGYASVTVEGMFSAHGISINEGEKGLFVSMPQTRDRKGEWKDVFHPITSEGRKALRDAVLSEFSVSLDALAVQKESTLNKIREAAKTAKEMTAPAPVKETKEKAGKKAAPEI
jgi:stage V sporulation protein G